MPWIMDYYYWMYWMYVYIINLLYKLFYYQTSTCAESCGCNTNAAHTPYWYIIMCIVSNYNDMYILQHVHGNALQITKIFANILLSCTPLLHDSAFFTPGQTSTALLRRSHWSQGLRHEGQTTSTFCVTRGEQHPNHTTKSKCHLYSDLCEFVWIHEIIRHHELKSLHIIDIQ